MTKLALIARLESLLASRQRREEMLREQLLKERSRVETLRITIDKLRRNGAR